MSKSPVITQSIDTAARTLLAGDLVAIPTETVYGLAADATNIVAIEKVFELKGRPSSHPLIVHCADATTAWTCADNNPGIAEKLADAFWPGPLTIVLQKSDSITSVVTGGQDSVAVRVPAHPLTLELLEAIDRPIVAPSANRFGRVSPTCVEHVRDEFPNSSLVILDGGTCDVGIESTIVDCRDSQSVRILRPGKITESDLAAVIGNSCIETTLPQKDHLRVSGNLPSHYSPNANITLVETGHLDVWLDKYVGDTTTTLVISQSKTPDVLPRGLSWNTVPGDIEEFARQMYALFRKADQQGYQQIVVELPVNQGIGIALRDRLKRAAN